MSRLPALIALAFTLLAAPFAHAATGEEAIKFVDSVGQRALAAVNAGEGEGQKQRLQQLFSENVDIDWMARFVLGRGWQQATEAQRARYLQAYKDHLLARYTANFADYNGSKYTIKGARDAGEGETMVSMTIKTPKTGATEVEAGYRVAPDAAGGFKIHDIMIEGVSLITTQRSEFASVLQRGGIDALIEQLKTKTASAG